MNSSTVYQVASYLAVFSAGIVSGGTGILLWFSRAIKRASREDDSLTDTAPIPMVPTEGVRW